MNDDATSHPGPLRGLVPYVVREPRPFALVLVAGILAAAAPIAVAGLGAALVGRTVEQGRTGGTTGLTALLIAAAAGAAVSAWWQSDVSHDWAFRLLRTLRMSLFDGLARAVPGRVFGKRTGDLTAAAVSDVNTTELFFAHTAGDYVGTVLVSAVAVAVIAALSAPAALVTLAVMVLVAVVPYVLARRAGAQGRILREQSAVLGSEVVDGLQGLRELAVFGQGRAYLERLLRHTDEQHRTRMRYAGRAGLEQAVTSLLLGGGAVAALLAVADQVRTGGLEPAVAPVVVVLAIASLGPVAAVSATARTLGDVRAAASRVLAIIDHPAHVDSHGTIAASGDGRAHVRFSNVHFGYDAGTPVLRGATFDVAPGETVALVGRSGAGKTTCVNLLLRFWDPQAGSITVDGTDLRSFAVEGLHSLISVVPQDVYLFNTTVRENIRLSRPDAGDPEVESAARLATAHDFVTDLADGYDTACGEGGAQLSGGQRQRVAIARALLTRTPIIVMDEAVSNLDAESERALHEALVAVRRDHTMLVVAHRLSTIRTADRVVLLDDGRVVDSGPHEEMLSRCAAYRDLLAAQYPQA
ncbi:thiol reductant ABC exporter subunit CydC [Micromonospora craniellae]|uniref:Thiol reductant ABC exporter subunit CydC n=1 Tax=Micromonospora craniellae TaxID=2294034 RepID=A0A372FXS2_9ACTN|nr:thiol reductant ABC exporter subunit CydC [Micromonospora craniellae]RFS45607.1 thiol reductant ABC exporter subunit CydC [Micromonospora craniellae]